MLLHDCALNEARQARGAAPITGLWFWGPGRREEVSACPSAAAEPIALFSNDPLGCAVGAASATARMAMPSDASSLLSQLSAIAAARGESARIVVVLHDLLRPALSMDLETWRSNLQRFEANWLAPLLAAYDNNTITALDLLAEHRALLELAPKSWRRSLLSTSKRAVRAFQGARQQARGLPDWIDWIMSEVQG